MLAEMNDSFEVAVVGLGPTGAVCTALLGSLGLKVIAIEREQAVYDKPRAFALDHEIMRVFEDLGIADAVAPHTAPFTPSEYYGVDGQLIKRLGALPPPWPLGWPPSMVFNQPAVDVLLRDRAASVAEIAFSELEHLAPKKDAVELRLRDRTLSARYVIACDGASSTVRAALGIEYEDLDFDQPWLVVDLLVSPRGLEKLPKVSIQYCEPERPSTYLIGVGSHRRWELMLNPNEEPDAWKLLARWITPDDAQLWRAASYRFHALVAREWRRGRVFLAGDAAHQQPPFTGQGMCQGIRDAANLSWKLHYVLAGKAKERLLDSYELERREHAKKLISVVKDIGKVICERNVDKARARDRWHLAEASGNVVTVPRQHLIPPLKGGLLSSREHAANGTLFPKDGGTGLRTVKRDASQGVVAQWFDTHNCTAAVVRPDHYVYGVARDEGALDRMLKEVAKDLK
jgi:3-(3-hydroxy-phenyl)propionate hydroxylase